MNKFRPFVLGAIGGAAAMMLLPLTGVINMSAEPGRRAPGDWLSYIAARQSVTLRSLGVDVPPDLDDIERIRRAAGHYEMVCADCHGSPTRPPQQFALNLTPEPPPLLAQMEQWRPEARVFQTVKHGIAASAMPAWPTQMRDDEVWDMVAFLRALPEVDAAQYQRFSAPAMRNTCAVCHGENGEGGGAGLPRLDTQSPAYIASALKAFRDGTRESGTMMAAARTLSDEELDALAALFGRQVAVDEVEPNTGSVIADRGIPERDIPACNSCHANTARADYPRLLGQDEEYLATQLNLFMDYGAARGGPRAQIMAEAVKHLTEEEAKALAAYYGR